MASTVAYATLEEVQSLLGGFTLPEDTEESDVQEMLEGASRTIDSLTNDFFGRLNARHVLSGKGSRLLDLSERTSLPALSVSEVLYRADYSAADNWDTDGEAVSPDTYSISPSRHSLRRLGGESSGRVRRALGSGVWAAGDMNYRVTGQFGRSYVPRPIKEACVLLVREVLTSGSAEVFSIAAKEMWPDGYMVERMGGVESGRPLTGLQSVDLRLRRFVRRGQIGLWVAT